MKSTTAENCVIFCTGYPIVFITLIDIKTLSGFSQIQQYFYFIFISKKCFGGQLTGKCRQNKNKIKYIVVFD